MLCNFRRINFAFCKTLWNKKCQTTRFTSGLWNSKNPGVRAHPAGLAKSAIYDHGYAVVSRWLVGIATNDLLRHFPKNIDTFCIVQDS